MPLRLHARARSLLPETVSPATVALVVDIIGQLMAMRRVRDLAPQERELLEAQLSVQTGLTAGEVASVYELVRADRAQATIRPEELRVLVRWHGEAGAARATRDVEPPPDPAEFAARHDLDAALMVFDLLVQLAVVDGEVERGELAGLERAAEALALDPAFVAALLARHDRRIATGGRREFLRGERVRIGRAGTCDLVLPSPQVAAHHAELLLEQGSWRVQRTGRRPVLVDGVPVASCPLEPGQRVRIGPYTLSLELGGEGAPDAVRVADETRLSILRVRGLSRKLGEAVLLDDISFSAFSGELIALVGPSGAGKTTLLQAVSGVALADHGEVALDGEDFHRLLRADRTLVADVPQDDLVLPELTVEESLRASGRLRLSADLSPSELQAEVDRVLDELGIDGIRGQRVGDVRRRGISGGQRKRVNVGQELLTRSTRVLFLDEPTSGLDPQAAHDIVGLLRRLADQGRIVFLVTHDLSPQLVSQVDHLMVLAPGGRLAWFGPPAEACRWFDVASPDAIFDRLRERAPEDWRAAFADSAACRRYVRTREHLLGGAGPQAGPDRADRRQRSTSSWRSLGTLVGRYARVRLRDRTGAVVVIAQPLILAAIMVGVFSHTTAALLFMATLSCLWFGMSGAVRELIVDRPVWRRERRVGVPFRAYLGSKVLVLAVVHALQAAAMLAVVHAAVGMGEAGVGLGSFVVTGVLTAWAGVSLGLLVGAAWDRSEAAVGTLVLLLVPQIAFSGILAPLGEVTPPARAASALTVQRYALHAALVGTEEVAYRSPVRGWQTQPARGATWNLGLRGDGQDDPSLAVLWGILLGFSVVQLGATTVVVVRRDR